jgi:hypothetical protein
LKLKVLFNKFRRRKNLTAFLFVHYRDLRNLTWVLGFQIGFAKMPEFFMPAPTAPIFATAGSAGTRKRILFGIEISEKDFFFGIEIKTYSYLNYSGCLQSLCFLFQQVK